MDDAVVRDGLRTVFDGTDVVVVGPAVGRRRYGRYLVRRLARALLVALILMVVIPMFMIHFFNLWSPELYPFERPDPSEYIRY
jgi:hypothetical protein